MDKIEKNIFEIYGVGPEAENLRREILSTIEEKEKKGVYTLHSLEKETKADFLDLQNDAQFLEYYLKVIKRTWAVDINDFEIPRKKGMKGKAEWVLKKIIWNLLKFYTYRLFSQQIEFNSQIKNTVLAMHREFSGRIEKIEKEILEIKGKGR